MNTIMDITRRLNLSEKRLFGDESRCNCKYSQLQVLQLWRKTQAATERDVKTPVCLMVDDTDYPKRGIQTEMIGKVFSHVGHKMILGFKGLFLGITDGATQMLMDFCLVGEKGKKGTYDLKPRNKKNANIGRFIMQILRSRK